jgi:hypothetical protein
MRTSKISPEALRETLVMTCGNVTYAAVLLEISKMHVIRLCAKHSLRDFARNLRFASGRAATGRPLGV